MRFKAIGLHILYLIVFYYIQSYLQIPWTKCGQLFLSRGHFFINVLLVKGQPMQENGFGYIDDLLISLWMQQIIFGIFEGDFNTI